MIQQGQSGHEEMQNWKASEIEYLQSIDDNSSDSSWETELHVNALMVTRENVHAGKQVSRGVVVQGFPIAPNK
jgi:hypothetical protein